MKDKDHVETPNWILSSLLEKYKYNDVLNSLANIESNRNRK